MFKNKENPFKKDDKVLVQYGLRVFRAVIISTEPFPCDGTVAVQLTSNPYTIEDNKFVNIAIDRIIKDENATN